MESNIFQRINDLIILINQKISESLSNGTLKYDKIIVKTYTVDNFNYKADGSIKHGGKLQDVLKDSGFKNEDIEPIKESILKSKEYINALNALNSNYESIYDVGRLDSLIYHITRLLGNKSALNQSNINFITETFIKELNNEPVKYGAIVELEGIIMLIDKVNITDGVILRKPTAKDIEEEISYPFNNTLSNPSAILNIELLAKSGTELQEYIEKTIALLKLYNVGSVDDILYRMYSDTIIGITGSIGSNFRKLNLEKYSLSKKDETKLIEFWNKIFNILPEGFFKFNPSEIDYLTIAYNRYKDSLLNDIPEKRVANAVMGLEALYLNNEGELKFRLSKRISKIMGLLGYDAIKIDQMTLEAYNIRSKFVHGVHLKSDKIIDYEKRFRGEKKNNGKKLEILNTEENMNDFIRKIIELLRISIIVFIFQRNEKNNDVKKELINLIDDSLIDKEKEKKLETLLNSYNLNSLNYSDHLANSQVKHRNLKHILSLK